MPREIRLKLSRRAAVGVAGLTLLFGGALFVEKLASPQMSGGVDVNVSKKEGFDNECAIAKNPANKDQMFVACNTSTGGLFAARSIDGGVTWVYPDPDDKTIADGDCGQGPKASWDPSVAWDTFGNLYLSYLDELKANVVILRSVDNGETFALLGSFGPSLPGQPDQPTVVASPPGAPPSVWVLWHQRRQMRAIGAKVTGLGTMDPWGPIQTIQAGGVGRDGLPVGCHYGDLAISPTGAVVQVCQSPDDNDGPSEILVNIDADGLGPGDFGTAQLAANTNVGGLEYIPLLTNSTDAEVGLAYDSNASSPRFKRLYLVYVDEVVDDGDDTDIMLRYSDDDGATWSNPPIRVNDDSPGHSQFLPRIAVNPASGNIAVCWLDARNSTTSVQAYCSIATPTMVSPTFLANAPISDGMSTSTGVDNEFGDYSGLAYLEGAHPVWADTSNSTSTGGNPDNPDGGGPNDPKGFDAYTDRVAGGRAANEGEPHIRTVDGVHYDFQSAGEFVLLRGDGLEIQVRQTPIGTRQPTKADSYTELSTCVSLNSAVAARVGKSVVSYQPSARGGSELQLYVDGKEQSVTAQGLSLDGGGRVVKSSTQGIEGIEIEFPNGTHLIATPGWLASQGKWYININVYLTTATEGIMGVLAQGSWLPALPDGKSLGPMPAALADRYAQLNKRFADAWRVKTSLFQYAQGRSTKDFTIADWPLMNQECVVPRGSQPTQGAREDVARDACNGILDTHRTANCIFDVTVTGDKGFADTYRLTERLEAGATITTVYGDKRTSRIGERVTFSVIVARKALRARPAPTGTVQFMLDDSKVGTPITLDSRGRATWETSKLATGNHKMAAVYIPSGNVFLPSNSLDLLHSVVDK